MTSTAIWQQLLLTPGDADLKARYFATLRTERDPRGELDNLSERIKEYSIGYFEKLRIANAQYETLIAPWREALNAQLQIANATVVFTAGWPGEINISARDFVAHAPRILEILPVRHLNLEAVAEAPEVFDTPQLKQIVSIAASAQPWTPPAITALATSPYLEALRWLDLSNTGLQEADVDRLAAAVNLRQLEHLDLRDNPSRDPVDASCGYGVDGISGYIVRESIWLPTFGHELEDRYGKINWLHALANYMEDHPPKRYEF